MRILLLHSSSDIYGASKIFLQTVQILQNHGHTCYVVVSSEGLLLDKLISVGAQVEIINLGIIRRKYFSLTGIINRIAKWKTASIQLNALIKKHAIELVYSNTSAVLMGTQVALKNKLPHYWHVHEIILKPAILRKAIQWLMYNRCAKIICVSKAVQEHWTKGNSQLLAKTQVIYNGIARVQPSSKPNFRTVYNIPNNAMVIGMAGRVHFWKGQQYFLQIAKELLAYSPTTPLYFIITGDAFPGYEYLVDDIKAFITDNKLEATIFYTGFETEMDTFYSSIDLLVLPSQLPDPLPTVVLEAMQYGIPVAATPQGGALEMVLQNETGIFIPMHNAQKAAELIRPILSPDIKTPMGEKAKARIQTYFNQSAFEKNMLQLFNAN
jgi:glycosyltransferase involved in cell wall biosynthesis